MAIPPFGAAPLPAQSGNSGKYLTTNGTSASWSTVAAGGQTLVTKVVASSGGDYTTLGAAIAAASSGWVIWVKDSTTESGSITTTVTNLTIIGANPEGTSITMNANSINLNGANTTVEGLKFIFTTGTFNFGAQYASMFNCHLAKSGNSNGVLTASGASTQINDNKIIMTNTNSTSDMISISGQYSVFNNNYVTGKAGSVNLLSVSGGDSNIVGNTFNATATGTFTSCIAAGTRTTVTGNSISCDNNMTYAVQATGVIVVSGNNIKGATIGVYLGNGFCVVSGNRIDTSALSTGIGVQAHTQSNTITSNLMVGSTAGASVGVQIDAFNYNVVVGNRINSYTKAVVVTTGATNCNVAANSFQGCTSGLNDSGTGTVIDGTNSS